MPIDAPRQATKNTGIVQGALEFAVRIDVQSASISLVTSSGRAMNASVFSSVASSG